MHLPVAVRRQRRGTRGAPVGKRRQGRGTEGIAVCTYAGVGDGVVLELDDPVREHQRREPLVESNRIWLSEGVGAAPHDVGEILANGVICSPVLEDGRWVLALALDWLSSRANNVKGGRRNTSTRTVEPGAPAGG